MTNLFMVLVWTLASAGELTPLQADARLRAAFALGKDANDQYLLDRIVSISDHVKKAFARNDQPAIKLLLRDAEELVGLGDDGTTMHGLPVCVLTGKQRLQLEQLTSELNTAYSKDDAPAQRATVQKIRELLGEQAGLPDSRRPGDDAPPPKQTPTELVGVFLQSLQADANALKALQQGIPGDNTMPRAYASVVLGCVRVRAQHPTLTKEQQALLDRTIEGCCKILLGLQMPSGFIKYPDLRDKHIRLGAMVQAVVERHPDAVQDGWVTVADPFGETLFDMSEGGIALLQAGAFFKNDAWLKAGTKAADWVAQQPCCAMAHDNAYAVSLLCEASRITKGEKYRTAAWQKYQQGIAVMQTPSGRWLLPYDARATSLFVTLRSLHDLQEILPAGADQMAVRSAAERAMKGLLPELVKLKPPMAQHTLQVLTRHAMLFPDRAKELQPLIEQTRGMLFHRTVRGKRVFAVVPLPELARLASP